MSASRIILFMSLCFTPLLANSQENKAFGAIQLSTGTLHVYRVLNLGYESPTLLQLGTKHQFRLAANAGLWQARLYNTNLGSQTNANLIYLFGGNAHKLEVNAGLTVHFDKGLKGQFLTHIGTLPKFYLGYRFEKTEQHLYYKVGMGWYEAVQLGIGWRF